MPLPPHTKDDHYRATNIRESLRPYTNHLQLRQEEQVPGWGTHEQIVRRMEVHNNMDGRTLTLTLDTDAQGPNPHRLTQNLQFGVEHLDTLLAALTAYRDDQARRAQQEKQWNATKNGNSR